MIGVLDTYLGKTNASYLALGKCSAADLIFLPWQELMLGWNKEFDIGQYPKFKDWHQSLMQRPREKKALKMQEEKMGGA